LYPRVELGLLDDAKSLIAVPQPHWTRKGKEYMRRCTLKISKHRKGKEGLEWYYWWNSWSWMQLCCRERKHKRVKIFDVL